jgi:Mce-associated membrane protein
MTRPNLRRPSSSRAPVSRPRRVAGQGSAPTEASDTTEVETPAELPPVEAVEAVETPEAQAHTGAALVEPVGTTETEAPTETPEEPAELAEKRGLATLFDSRRATVVLLAVVAVLALVAGGLFTWDALRGDEETKPSKQPVVISGDDATTAVDAAAKAAQTILTRNYAQYDKQIDEATALMTPAFAKQFRETADGVKPEFVADKVDQQVRVVGQGVVHATRTEVQALLFMNYYISKDASDTTYTAYRVLVTVVHTTNGWLVSKIDTK